MRREQEPDHDYSFTRPATKPSREPLVPHRYLPAGCHPLPKWRQMAQSGVNGREDGVAIDPSSLAFCPHEWINDSGYVVLTLVQKSSRPFSV